MCRSTTQGGRRCGGRRSGSQQAGSSTSPQQKPAKGKMCRTCGGTGRIEPSFVSNPVTMLPGFTGMRFGKSKPCPKCSGGAR